MPDQAQNQQEIRFAVVLYGGVSLAIYINGVAQEMRNLVRATSGEAFSDEELKGTAPVYQRLAYILRRGQAPRDLPGKKDVITSTGTRFLVDVISGTSAGGINGIFLAKSLANSVPMTSLQDLWFQEGAIQSLLNDKESDDGTNLTRPAETESLLNSRRMYLKLLNAFDGMDELGRPQVSTDITYPEYSLGDEIDLFATTTDIEGVPVPIQLFDNVVYERRYRNAFHLQYRKEIRNDFQADNNPFLAFASRCTSSFPFAFEPMRLCNINEILDRNPIYAHRPDCSAESQRWQRYYTNYLSGVAEGITPFPKRAFGDGGYLNNAPFSYAVDALLKRQSIVPITRKLIYVEPSPDHVENTPQQPTPNAIENSIDALITIPGYQTIRNDLTRVLERNRAVTRINRTLSEVEAEIQEGGLEASKETKPDSENSRKEIWFSDELCLRAYYRMRAAEITDLLTQVVARARSIDEDSAYFFALRALIRTWGEGRYGSVTGVDGKTDFEVSFERLKDFLTSFDLPYRIRRLQFLARKLDVLYSVEAMAASNQPEQDWSPAKKEAMATLRFGLGDANALAQLPSGLVEMRALVGTQYKALKLIIDELMQQTDTRAEEESLKKDPNRKPTNAREFISAALPGHDDIYAFLAQIINNPGQKPPQETSIKFVTTATRRGDNDPGDLERLRDTRARTLLESDSDVSLFLQNLEGVLSNALSEILAASYSVLDAAFAVTPAGNIAGRLFANFNLFDAIQFPMMFGTDIISTDTIDILRIAPEDAACLIPDVAERRKKLKGLAVAHFGAFLDQDWRISDLLWGRLDAAERLITSLLPYDSNVTVRNQLIEEAHSAIFADFDVHGRLKDMTTRQVTAQGPANQISDAKITQLLAVVAPSPIPPGTDSHRKLMQVWQAMVPRGMDRKAALLTIARSTTIFGRMLETISAKKNFPTQAGWLVNVGRAFWGVVEISVPRSILGELGTYWQWLILLIALLLIGCGITFAPAVLGVGWSLLGFSILLVTLRSLLGWYMGARASGWWKVLEALAAIAVLFVLIAGLFQAHTWILLGKDYLVIKIKSCLMRLGH